MSIRVSALRCEHLKDPIGIEVSQPRLSWHVVSDGPGTRQVAYQIQVASGSMSLTECPPDMWDSGRVDSRDNTLIPYEGIPLTSRARAHWRVRVWDETGMASVFSSAGYWEMGLLDSDDWAASWIGGLGGPASVSYLSRTIQIAQTGVARAYVTALGIYELQLNGSRVGTDRLSPGWTDYAQRIHYQVYDVSELLIAGDNRLTIVLASGWYAGRIGWLGDRAHYGDTPQALLQLELDGQIVLTTDNTWTLSEGPIRSSDLLLGESHDNTWPSTSRPAPLTMGTPARRVPSPAPAVKIIAELRPISVTSLDAQTHLIDLGQNLSGALQLRLQGGETQSVRVRHAEALDADGGLYLDNLRGACAVDTYVLNAAPQTYEPSFTFHGFRYAELSGYPHPLALEDVTALVIGSDLEVTGDFSCSDARVNQLFSNIVWGARSNFLDIPTDCPQRDERMGWTGDAQVFAPTANYLFNTAGFFTKWLRDLADTQTPEGSVCDVAPRVLLGPEGSAGWADAAVLVPWAVSQWFDDDRLLAEMYDTMRAWVFYVRDANPDLLWLHKRGYDNGDWLNVEAETDKDLIATAFFARSARTTAMAAAKLGHTDDLAGLELLAEGIVQAFRSTFVLPDGALKCETQTAYALALRFGLLPPGLEPAAARRLVTDIEAHDGHLTCGFLGVAHLLPALTEAGHAQVAYRLLLQDDFPSWLHSVASGATTIWERWDGWTSEQGFYNAAMNSLNHYAFGAVGEWLMRTVGGIDIVEPGGRSLLLAPIPGNGLDWARASWLSPQGPVSCSWHRQDDTSITVEVDVPTNATAQLFMPGDPIAVLLDSGHHVFTQPTSTQGSHHVSSS